MEAFHRGGAREGDDVLFTELAEAADQRLGEFSTQDLANSAWAFAMARHLGDFST